MMKTVKSEMSLSYQIPLIGSRHWTRQAARTDLPTRDVSGPEHHGDDTIHTSLIAERRALDQAPVFKTAEQRRENHSGSSSLHINAIIEEN